MKSKFFKMALMTSSLISLVSVAAGKSNEFKTELKSPDKVIFDATSNSCYIANVDGSQQNEDGKASIIALKVDLSTGKPVFTPSFFFRNQGKKNVLDSPRGMCISDGQMLVADVNKVRFFDIAGTGTHKGTIGIPGATNISSIVVAGEHLFLGDQQGRKVIYVKNYKDSKARSFHNLFEGLVTVMDMSFDAASNTLYCVSKNDNFLYAIDVSTGKGKGKAALKVPNDMTGFTAITPGANGEFYLLHRNFGVVFVYTPGEGVQRKPIVRGLERPTGLAYDAAQNLLFITSEQQDLFQVYPGVAKVAGQVQPSDDAELEKK